MIERTEGCCGNVSDIDLCRSGTVIEGGMQQRGSGLPSWDGGDARDDRGQEDEDDVGNADAMDCLHD